MDRRNQQTLQILQTLQTSLAPLISYLILIAYWTILRILRILSTLLAPLSNATKWFFLRCLFWLVCLEGLCPETIPALDLNQDSLRLARLSPGGSLTPLEVELRSFTFATVPAYEALSYTWGEPYPKRPIVVNGQPWGVTGNLHNALLHLSDPTLERWFWIDALCIKQTDNVEKGHQIPLMASIYARAEQVRVFLPEAGDVTDKDVELFKSGARSGIMHDESWAQTRWLINELLHQDYWSRMWVIQEMVAASKLVIQLGVHVFEWPDFYKIMSLHSERTGGYPHKATIDAVHDFRLQQYELTQEMTLFGLLDRFRDGRCWDPLDKVYGLLGLAWDVSQNSIAVDYSKSQYEVYRDIVRFQNHEHGHEAESRARLPYMASLVRRLLSRRSGISTIAGADPQESKFIQNIESSQLQDEEYCIKNPTSQGLCKDRQIDIQGRFFLKLAYYHSHTRQNRKVAFWYEDRAENRTKWDMFDSSRDLTRNIRVNCRILGHVTPTSLRDIDIRSSAYAEKNWRRSFSSTVRDWPESSRASILNSNERLMAILRNPKSRSRLDVVANTRLDTHFEPYENMLINPFLDGSPQYQGLADDLLTKGVVGFGSPENEFMALVPTETETGDVVCQFYGSRVSAVIRQVGGDHQYTVVGTAGVVTAGTDLDWDLPTDLKLFTDEDHTRVVELSMNVRMLTMLSLDSFFLPYVLNT